MIRALYTAASGMNAQQTNIDNVAHNLANVNTTGFKKSRVEFEDLVYQQMRAPGSPASATTEAPVGLEIGLGTRAVATARNFSAGNLRSTSAPLDIAIEGDGLLPDRAAGRHDGLHARRHVPPRRAGPMVTAEGYSLEPQITVPANATSISHLEGRHRLGHGRRARRRRSSSARSRSRRSRTRPGLRAARRQPVHADDRVGRAGDRRAGHRRARHAAQGFVEDSNVSVVEEMVNMIIGQRAYEANSRVVKAADEMLARSTTSVR